jgi:hypothetical protein
MYEISRKVSYLVFSLIAVLCDMFFLDKVHLLFNKFLFVIPSLQHIQ